MTDRMITEKQVRTIAEEGLAGTDKFIVDVLVKAGNKIMVFIDCESTLTIDDCRALSRFIESRFDRETMDFELQVSSPGADRPLKDIRQYRKHIGRKVEVLTVEEKKITGTLTQVDDQGIILKVQEKPKTLATETIIPMSGIKEIKTLISFK